MKRNSSILSLYLLLISLLLTNCSTNETETDSKELLGTWVSIDKSDTLEFTSENDFNKSNGFMTTDHYDYELFKDSIEIGYRGKLYILVTPTKHKYSLDNETLTIDFQNTECYGFERKEMTYMNEK